MAAFKKRIGAAKDGNSSGDVNMHLKGGSKLCRTEFYLWVTTSVARKAHRPQSNVGQIICDQYDAWVTQFESDNGLRQQQLAIKTQSKAFNSMRSIVSSNLKPYIDDPELINQLMLMEIMFKASWNSNFRVGSLNKNQVKRKFGKLIIGKTTGYFARWLFRLLKKEYT